MTLLLCRLALIADAAAAPPLPRLRDMAPPSMHIGSAMHWDNVQAGAAHPNASIYAALQSSQFSMSQDKNCMNWAFVEYATRGVWRWAPADSFVAWCANHTTLVRGHGLAWGAHLPSWLLELNKSKSGADAAIARGLNESITAIVSRYRGRVYAWHAVLEPFGDPHWKQPIWKPNLLLEALSTAAHPERYVEQVFALARAADPHAKLCVLDYKIAIGIYTDSKTGEAVWDHSKANAVYDILRGWKMDQKSSLALDLDCICMESHLQPHTAANRTVYTWLRTNFDRYAAIGVEVHINAFTISIESSPSQWTQGEKFNAQGTWYAVFLSACIDSPACIDFESYGLTDKWDMGSPETSIFSLPFDVDYQPKPAFWAMVGVLNGSHPRPAK